MILGATRHAHGARDVILQGHGGKQCLARRRRTATTPATPASALAPVAAAMPMFQKFKGERLVPAGCLKGIDNPVGYAHLSMMFTG